MNIILSLIGYGLLVLFVVGLIGAVIGMCVESRQKSKNSIRFKINITEIKSQNQDFQD